MTIQIQIILFLKKYLRDSNLKSNRNFKKIIISM